MKRTLSLLLAVLMLLLPLLSGCGEQKPPVTEEEIFPLAADLLERSVLVNNILLGDGIPTGNEAFGEFFYADTDWEDEKNVHSVEDILKLATDVYTNEVYTVLYSLVITKDGQIPPDYQNRGAPATGLLVYKGREGMYENTTHEYLTDTMTLTQATADKATVTVTVRITPEGYEPQERVLTLTLALTDRGWRCDKLTCIAYDYSKIDN